MIRLIYWLLIFAGLLILPSPATGKESGAGQAGTKIQLAAQGVASVNGETITRGEVEKVIANMRLIKKEQDRNREAINQLLKTLNEAKGKDIKEQVEFQKWMLTKNLISKINDSTALTRLIRDKILFQEARKQGLEVSMAETRRRVNEMRQALASPAAAAARKQQQEQIKAAGYQSEDQYFEDLLPAYRRLYTISNLENNFKQKEAQKYPDLQGYRYEIQVAKDYDAPVDF